MIDYQFNMRDEFKEDVQSFCLRNDITLHFMILHCSAGATPDGIHKLQLYIEELEVARTKYRRSKSYIWQLFH